MNLVTNQRMIERIQGVGLWKRVVSKLKIVCHRSLLHEGEQAATHVHLPPLHHPHLKIRKSSPKNYVFMEYCAVLYRIFGSFILNNIYCTHHPCEVP